MTKLARKRIYLLLGVAGAAALLAWSLRPRPVAVDLAPAARRGLAVTLDEEGETRVRARYVVAAPVAGRVLRIALEPGDPVVAGETVLATLLPADPVPLDPRVRGAGEARVAAARAALGQAEARRGEARTALDLAERELARQEALAAAGIAAERDLDAARAAAEGRRDAVEAATFARDAAGHELAAARAALLEPGAGGGGTAGAVTL
ncbi:MAG TPA: efflux transporter periplasmic adaptor subunit, partial [Thermoanaerobaculia bacterium]